MEKEYLSQNPYFDHFGDEQWTMIGMHENDGKMLQAAIDIGAGTYNISVVPMIHFATSNIVIHDYPVYTFAKDDPNYAHVLWYGWEQTWVAQRASQRADPVQRHPLGGRRRRAL